MDQELREIRTHRKIEKERCIAWLEHAREQGETDMRQVINWIDTGKYPGSVEDDD